MRNLETPTFKVAVYGACSGLGNALLVSALQRQYEVTALVDDLNALAARPGLRCKQGEPNDAVAVSQSVAGMDAVICLLNELYDAEHGDFSVQFRALLALLDGLEVAGVKRLLVVDDCTWLEQPETLIPVPAQHLQERLLASPIAWTLVEAPAHAPRVTLEACADGQAHTLPLLRFAAALLDEIKLSLHVHERVRIAEGDS